ncbi:MAG: hypothetical protein H6Q19_1402 [Bacteroidetes bacterium]|nr:hypothetical protein [Bacteroidota bacterium]
MRKGKYCTDLNPLPPKGGVTEHLYNKIHSLIPERRIVRAFRDSHFLYLIYCQYNRFFVLSLIVKLFQKIQNYDYRFPENGWTCSCNNSG